MEIHALDFTRHLSAGFRHLRQGTLRRRLEYGLECRRAKRQERRRQFWQRQMAEGNASGDGSQYQDMHIQLGVHMRLPLDSRLSQYIYCDDFEASERQFLNVFLRPGDVFVDVGANIGLFSLIAARQVGSQGRVYAFEPCARTFERLETNIALNRLTNVSRNRVALSSQNARREMSVSVEGFDAWNSLTQPTQEGEVATEVVDCVTWDDFAREQDLTGGVTLMKIDVEGWEAHVLCGASATLSREDAPVLQIEFTEEAARAAGSSCEQLYRTLEDLGYRMFVYNARSNRLVPDPLRESYPYLNLLATKNPRAVTARLQSQPPLPSLIKLLLPF